MQKGSGSVKGARGRRGARVKGELLISENSMRTGKGYACRRVNILISGGAKGPISRRREPPGAVWQVGWFQGCWLELMLFSRLLKGSAAGRVA